MIFEENEKSKNHRLEKKLYDENGWKKPWKNLTKFLVDLAIAEKIAIHLREAKSTRNSFGVTRKIFVQKTFLCTMLPDMNLLLGNLSTKKLKKNPQHLASMQNCLGFFIEFLFHPFSSQNSCKYCWFLMISNNKKIMDWDRKKFYVDNSLKKNLKKFDKILCRFSHDRKNCNSFTRGQK